MITAFAGGLMTAYLPATAGQAQSEQPQSETKQASPVATDQPKAKDQPDGDPYIDRVVEFKVGQGGGFNEDKLPDIILGPPQGGGEFLGSAHVVSLGRGGSITVEFVDNEVIDGEGIDFLIFENAIAPKRETKNAKHDFDLAKVEVSSDGKDWKAFPYDTATRMGCAGHHPVFSNPESEAGRDISPTDPEKAGGDPFDLKTVGLKTVRFIRITDLGLNEFGGPKTHGFDLDAIAAVHSQLRPKQP